MDKVINETKNRIKEIEKELKSIASQLDQERKEATQEDNLSIHNELMDKKQYLETQLYRLNEGLAKLTLKKSNAKKQVSNLELGMEATVDMNGSRRNMTIVSPIQANPTKGLISSESPMGQALLGKAVGETIDIETPAGLRTFAVLDIKI